MSAVVLAGGKVLGSGSNVFITGNFGFDGSISVGSSGNLVNGHGTTVQLRGANIQQSAFFMIQQSSPTIGSTGVVDASGGLNVNDQAAVTSGSGAGTVLTATGPNTTFMAPWKFNTIRVGINEANWLGYSVYQMTGTSASPVMSGAQNPDNFGIFTNLSYPNQIISQVSQLTAAGYYVILTLAGTHPGLLSTCQQDVMADQDHSIQLWQSVAAVFGYPNGTALIRNGGTVANRAVIFELFNEPFTNSDTTAYTGGFINGYYQNGSPFVHLTGLPVTGLSGTFTPGESFTATNGTAGKVANYYVNTTTGLASSGTTFLHVYNVTGTNTSGNLFTTAIPIPVGTTITGSSSGATAQISSLNSGQFGWYVAGNQQMLSAIRTAGAGNVVLCSGTNFAHQLSGWLTNMAGTDTTAPAGWVSGGFGAWTSQLGAHWHPYPAFSQITAVTVQSGGSGYAVNDTILLPMDESGGANSGGVYWQAQLKVTGVSGGVINGIAINPYTGGTPGVAGGQNGITGNSSGGVYSNLLIPSNPVAQSTTSGSGSGATFNLTFTNISAGGGAEVSNLPGIVAIKTAGYPVALTETGEHTGTGIVGAPWMAELTSWADTNGISVVTYAYTPNIGWFNAQGYDFTLALSTLTGGAYRTPSPGYGVFMFNWLSTHSP
jgi:hypothetical protein